MLKQYIQHIRSLKLPHSRLTGWVTGMLLLLAVISQAQITTGYIVKGGPDTGTFSGGVLIGTTSKINYALTEQRVLIDEKPGISEGSWKDVTGINQNTASLTKTAVDGWGNAGAASNSILDTLENGWIQYKVNNLSDVLAFGLSVSNVDAHYNSIDYAVMINAGQLYVYNHGQLVGNYGVVALNDSIRIARIGNILFFTRNGILFYNREVDIKQPVMADIALYSQSMVFEMKSSFAKPLTTSLIDDIIAQIGMRDTTSRIFDRFGNTYTYGGITKSGNNSNPQPQDVSCTPGYFSLDFVGDGFETNLDPNQQNMRDVLCQVFNDLSALIQPSQCNGTIPTVNIRVVTVPPGAPSNALGAATPYYTIPPSNTNTGIIDGDVWKAINSGVNDPTLFDGELQVRFTLPNNATWNFNTTSTNFPGQYDAYSVYLHEAIHLLGFNTLIGANGQSIAPGLSHHYSRYDAHLNSDNNGAFINWDNCYSAVFNVPVSNITAGCPHITFNGANAGTQPAFAPSPNYLQGTSLSHFDDNCPSPNSHNFVMNASLALNTFHRVPTAQEVNALKDLGYITTGTFGAAPTVPTTGLPSGGQVVAGVDDGFINQCGINNDLNVCANNATITVQPLANDIGAATFDCLVNVSGFGIVTNNNNTSFTFNPNGQTGVAMFTYIPVGAAPNFQRGNITSIRIIVSPCGATCATPLNCNQICNPDFQIPVTCNNNSSPFWIGCVSGWLNGHGTPQITDSSANNFNVAPELAFMAAGLGDGHGGEGILTNVNIQPNKKYIFSYQRKVYNNFAPIDNVHIRLLNSNNLGGSNIPTVIENPIPIIPPVNIEILNETNVTSYTDEQVTICFTTPNDTQSYNWLWIYPDQNTGSSSSILLVDWVELMEDNFSAGPDQAITCGDVTVGLTPLCSIRNVTDLWTWGSNQSNDDQLFFTANNHNQLTQNTTFTLTRTIPANPGGLANSCSTSDNVSVTINNSLQLTTSTTGANCAVTNGTAAVTVTEGTAPYTYEWKDSANTIYITQGITGLAPGTYTITVTDVNGCSNTATAIVNELPLSATISVNNNGQLCEGDSIKFTTTFINNATYNWSGPNNFSSTSQNPIIANADQNNSGAYILTVAVSGCTNGLDTAIVVVNPRPAKPIISGDTLICAGTPLSLSSPVVSGDATYTWVAPNSTTVNGPNLIIPNATVANSGTYYFTITSNNCTSPKDSIHVTVDTVLTPSVNSNSPVCAGDTIKLFAAQIAGASYSWTGPNGFSSSIQNPIRVNALTAYAGTYSVTINVNGCTSAAGSTNVIIRPKPATPVITTNSPVCVGGTINLNTPAIAGGTYSWTYPNTSTNTSQNPTITNATTADGGTYTLMVRDAFGCSSLVASKIVIVNPILATPTANSTSPVCAGDTIKLSTPFVSNASYSWTGPNSFASTAQNPFIANASVLAGGTYTVTVKVNGCTSVAGTTTVVVNPIPSTPAANSNSPVCPGDTIKLSTPFVSNASYSWTGPNSFASTAQTPFIANASVLAGGTYTVTVKVNGCTSAVGTTTVVVNPIPSTPAANSNSPVCPGDTIKLSTPFVSNTSYSWTGPNSFVSTAQNPFIANASVLAGGTYTVTVKVNGCTSVAGTTTVVVNPIPSTPAANSNSPVCPGDTLKLSTSFVSNASYSWTGPNSFASSTQNPTLTSATLASAGTYSVTVTVNGCTSAAGTTIVTVNPIPTTPIVNSNSPVCPGDTIKLSTLFVSNASYSWTGPNSFASTAQNPFIVNASALSTGTYTLTIVVNGCNSTTATTTVSLNPLPVMTGSPTATICSGSTLNFLLTSNIPSNYTWVASDNSNTTGESLSPQSGNLLNDLITNNTGTSQIVSYNVTPISISGNCSGSQQTIQITVNPKPNVMASPSSQTICSGAATGIALTSNVSTALFSWTVAQSAVSGAVSGNGSSINQTLTATGTNSGTATYTITPAANGCGGTPVNFVVTVNPAPTVTATPSALAICSGGTGTINLSGNITGTTFSWTVNQGANIFGGTGGSGNTISANLFNLGNTSGTATYTITPSNSGCNGTPLNYSVTINPIPAVSPSVLSQTICSGNTTSIGLSSTVSGTNFSWTIGTQSSGIGGASASSGNTIAQTLTNSSTSNGTVGYLVTGVSLAGCAASDTIGVNVTVKPAPVMQGTLTYTVCSGAAANITLTSNIPSTYSWVTSNNPNTVGESTTPQSGNIITDVINNSTTVAQTLTYTVTPTSSPGGCSGIPQIITVTVNPPSACCLAINYTIPVGGAQTSSLFGATVTGQNIAVNGNLTVNSNVTFSNCNFIMAAGTKITVNNSYKLTLNNQTHLYSCTNMWDGIYVNAGGQLFITGSTFIEDALNAVEIPNNGGHYNINGAIFNRNLMSVDLKGYTNNYAGTIINTIITSRNIASYPNPLNNVTVATLKGNSSQSLTTWPLANLKASNSQYKAVFGINATNVKYMIVGIDGGNLFTNIFDNLMCGINLMRTSSDIYNNRFQNLLNTTNVSCLQGAPCYNIRGIGIRTNATPINGNAIGNYSVNIGCTSCNGAGNKFINTHQAISVTNYKKIYIQKNTISNSTTGSTGTSSPPGYGNLGIMVKPAPGDSVIIRNNSINNCATGIFVNRVSGTTINHPKGLIVDNDSITASGTGYCTNAIYIADYTTSVFAQVSQINTNTIINAQNGIVLSNLKTTKILNNLINVLDAPTGARNGIKATGCYGVSILNNHTKSTSTLLASSNLSSYGIYLSQSRNMVVKCNLVENAGRSLVFEGNCMSPTNMGYGILQNTLRKAQYGFVLKTNGVIGTQGNATNKKSDNIWEGGAPNFTLAQTLAELSNATNSILFVTNDSVTATRPVNNQRIGTGSVQYQWNINVKPSSGQTINCVSTYGNWRSMSVGDAEYAVELKAMEEDSSQFPVYNEETHWQHKKHVFDEIENNPQLTDNNDLNNFHNAHLNHTIGKLAKVNDKILQGNFNAASAINSNITPANVLEQNQQTVNELILKSAIQPDYIYTSIDSSMLMSIATQCPLAGGNAVYQARNLLMSIASNVIEFEDNCIDGNSRMEIVDNAATNKDNTFVYKLYPNPNDGNMIFEYSLQHESTGILILYEITGRVINKYNLIEGQNSQLKISEAALLNGIYFYSVVVDGKVLSNSKFVISK